MPETDTCLDTKPCAPATERNRAPIEGVLRQYFADRHRVLEIGSGTGQHAVHFAGVFPHLVWQTSDRAENLAGIASWLADARLPNTPTALHLDVSGSWPEARFDAVFSANTLHIMSWREVELMFSGLRQVLTDDAVVVVYGPFNYNGEYTSESNRDFDHALKADAPHRGIRDHAAVDALAASIGLAPIADLAMPANNRCLVWRRLDCNVRTGGGGADAGSVSGYARLRRGRILFALLPLASDQVTGLTDPRNHPPATAAAPRTVH